MIDRKERPPRSLNAVTGLRLSLVWTLGSKSVVLHRFSSSPLTNVHFNLLVLHLRGTKISRKSLQGEAVKTGP